MVTAATAASMGSAGTVATAVGRRSAAPAVLQQEAQAETEVPEQLAVWAARAVRVSQTDRALPLLAEAVVTAATAGPLAIMAGTVATAEWHRPTVQVQAPQLEEEAEVAPAASAPREEMAATGA